MFVLISRKTGPELPHDPPHKPFVFSSRPIWILVPLWGMIIALALVSSPRRAQAEDGVRGPVQTQENCAQTKSDSKIFNKAADDPRAIEERKKCFSSHFESDAGSHPQKAVGERVMQPEYGAGQQDQKGHDGTHTVQQRGGKTDPEPAAASGYLKIGDIKGESTD